MEVQNTSILYSVATIFLLHCLITCCTATPTIKTDESALLALKSSISYDPHSIISTNWSRSTPVCSWIGVVCSSRHERVTALNISGMNLQGRIPPEMGNLSFLVSLRMKNNSFDGSLPREFVKLRRIRVISLSNNNLSGPIPSFVSLLPNLESLFLWGNQFSGSIPTSIANASKLEELDLSYNLLRGKIPPEIGNISYLSSLHLESNGLTGPIPLPILNLSALQLLELSTNNLTGRLPESICNTLPRLQGLFLSRNRFEGTIPSSLWKCEQLQVLSLSFNEFVGSIPREIGNLTSLTELYLGYNNLEGSIPKEICNLQKLEKLNLDLNGLSGSIPTSIFNFSALWMFSSVMNNLSGNLPGSLGQGMPNLQRLYLGANRLRGFIPNSISNASKLIVLDLAINSFTGPIPNSLGNLEFLQVLHLDGNRLMSTLSSSSELSILTSLTSCQILSRLALAGNPLGGKLPTSIGNFSTSLESLSAFGCRIHGNLPQEIGNVSTLAFLSLSSNELIGNIPTTIIGLEKLQQLNLAGNNITGIIPDEICSLKNVGELRLSQNQILGALPACLGNMTSLRYLYLDSNRLNSSLPTSMWRLNDILEFDASSNMLRGNLPLEVENWKALTLLNLSKNNLSSNIPNTIGGLERLINFSLAHNRLKGSIPNSFGRLLSLEHLDISHNNLTGEIPKSLEALSYLTYFDGSFNDLSGEIPSGGPFVNFTRESFMHNRALCGGASRFQLPPCHLNSHDEKRKKRALHIALYTTLAFAFVIIALVGLATSRCQKRRKDENDQTLVLPPQVQQRERISYNELLQATDGFNESNILGRGGFSSVYKGKLSDGSQVAVKVFDIQLEGASRSFDTECEVLRSLRHRNLTKVISSCTNLEFRALVLEYMPNGSLHKWLYSHNYFLDILQRLNIVIDVAYALDYLHNGYLMPVLHCDLKPSNVLLDTELVGHVSDFGVSKILGAGDDIARTKTLATIGYIAPEYGLEGLVSTRSDTYSYGILLMETFTRITPSDDMFAGELSLKQWINDALSSDISRVVDSNLLTEGGNFDAKLHCLGSIMELALKCTQDMPELRIAMKDAARDLGKIKLQFLTSCGKS